MLSLLKRIWGNPEQDAIIKRMEVLRNAMYAETPQELRFYLKQLETV